MGTHTPQQGAGTQTGKPAGSPSAAPKKQAARSDTTGKAPAKAPATAQTIKQAPPAKKPVATAPSPPAKPAAPPVPKDLTLNDLVNIGTLLVPKLNQLVQSFWGTPVRLRFFSVADKELYFCRADDFFVSQVPLGKKEDGLDAQIRISDTVAASLFSQVLGPRTQPGLPFQYSNITELESTLLDEFSRTLLTELKNLLIQKPDQSKKPTKGGNQVLHLVWMVIPQTPSPKNLPVTESTDKKQQPLYFTEPPEGGKIILSVPRSAIKPIILPPGKKQLAENALLDAETPAHLQVGSTRVPLADIKDLETGDIVVLTDSKNDEMYLLDKNTEQSSEQNTEKKIAFFTEISNAKTITLPYTQEIEMMEQTHDETLKQNLWDNLTIEVRAEFEPIKLPLKQLKQMSEGLVVEVGDIIHNDIYLVVEEKTLAKGELVIVGDKFGVRINKILTDTEAAQVLKPAQPKGTAKPAKAPAPQTKDSAPAQGPKQGMDEGAIAPEKQTPDIDSFLNDDFDDDDW